MRSTWYLLSWLIAVCMYSYRTATKHLDNLRFVPQFSEGFDFVYLVGPIRTHELVWAPWSWFEILHNQEPVCDPGHSPAHFRIGRGARPLSLGM